MAVQKKATRKSKQNTEAPADDVAVQKYLKSLAEQEADPAYQEAKRLHTAQKREDRERKAAALAKIKDQLDAAATRKRVALQQVRDLAEALTDAKVARQKVIQEERKLRASIQS